MDRYRVWRGSRCDPTPPSNLPEKRSAKDQLTEMPVTGSTRIPEWRVLCYTNTTYLFEEQDELDDETGEAVDAGDEVSKTDEEGGIGEGKKHQSDGIEPPRYFIRQFSALDVSDIPVQQQPHKRHRLGRYLRNCIFTL